MADEVYIEDKDAVARGGDVTSAIGDNSPDSNGYAYVGSGHRDIVNIDIDVHESQYPTVSVNTGGGPDQVALTGGKAYIDTGDDNDLVIIDSDHSSSAISASVDTGEGDDVIFVGRDGFGPVDVDVRPGSGINSVQLPVNEVLDERLSATISLNPVDCDAGSLNVVDGMDVLPADSEYESFADSIQFGSTSFFGGAETEVSRHVGEGAVDGIPIEGALVLHFNEKGSDAVCEVVFTDVQAEDVGDLAVKSYSGGSISVQLKSSQ